MKRPHILVTNDDGIDSFFLLVLVEALAEKFDVTVAAPMAEKSWIGRAFTRHGEVHLARSEQMPCPAYALDGTPSDCVNIALAHLLADNPPVAVCSGINLGFNAGLPLLMSSGTIAGATEGAMWGLAAFAFSHLIRPGEFDGLRERHGRAEGPLLDSLRIAAAHATVFVEQNLAETDGLVVHNVNFPAQTLAETPIRRTQPGRFAMRPMFQPDTATSYKFTFTPGKAPEDPDNDLQALQDGAISHTVIDYRTLGALP